MMAIALRLARRGLGNTAPNPAVGAVIADESTGEVIARGWTQPGGRPHAEPEAIGRAGDRARGKTMYVTLEPCSHHGRTPPCADAIVAAGLSRVVLALGDPDPRVSGRGLGRLAQAGIAVERGLMVREARLITSGHILRVTERRPMVQLKLAVGADGAVPRGGGGRPQWVTSPEARAHGHLLRAEADAILVGHGTVRDDDPDLTCRLPGLEGRSPLRVVLAADAGGLAGTRLMQTAGVVPVLVYCERGAAPEAARALAAPGVSVHGVGSVGGRLWLPAVLEDLVARGVTRLIVEGGPRIWQAFSSSALFDEVALYVAGGAAAEPRTDPEAGTRLAASAPGTHLARYGITGPLAVIEERRIGPDRFTLFARS